MKPMAGRLKRKVAVFPDALPATMAMAVPSRFFQTVPNTSGILMVRVVVRQT